MPEQFIKKYESALATQNWNDVAPLFSENAAVTFSDGSVHQGIGNIQKAFEKNFAIIKSEKYSIRNVTWLKKDDSFTVYLFEYSWAGIINSKAVSGSGIGTSVLIKEDGTWRLISEHLGKGQ